MNNYEIMIYNETGAIVLFKTIQADNENEAIKKVLNNVELLDGDSIKIKKKEEE